MKRTISLFALVGVAGVLVPVLAVFAQTSSHENSTSSVAEPCCAVPTCTPCSPAKAVSTNDKLLDELTTILQETKSPETFIVTTMVLSRMGPEAKQALPGIIRNAERLGVLASLYKSNDSDAECLVADLIGALDTIVGNKDGVRVWNGKNLTPAFSTPASNNYGYAPTTAPAYPVPQTVTSPMSSCGAASFPSYGTNSSPVCTPPYPTVTPTAVKPEKQADPLLAPTYAVPTDSSLQSDYRLSPIPAAPAALGPPGTSTQRGL